MTILVVLLRGNQARQSKRTILYYLNINLEFAKNGLDCFTLVVKFTMPLFNHEVVIGLLNIQIKLVMMTLYGLNCC